MNLATLSFDGDLGVLCTEAFPVRPLQPTSPEDVAAAEAMYAAWAAWREAKAVHDRRKDAFDRLVASNSRAFLHMSFALVGGHPGWGAK